LNGDSSNLHVLNRLTHLQKLDIGDNGLASLPLNFLNNSPAIVSVYVDDNPLRSLPSKMLEQCPTLQLVSLIETKLTTPQKAAFGSRMKQTNPTAIVRFSPKRHSHYPATWLRRLRHG
jgi:Leucine-rich repeat (LRR) protein